MYVYHATWWITCLVVLVLVVCCFFCLVCCVVSCCDLCVLWLLLVCVCFVCVSDEVKYRGVIKGGLPARMDCWRAISTYGIQGGLVHVWVSLGASLLPKVRRRPPRLHPPPPSRLPAAPWELPLVAAHGKPIQAPFLAARSSPRNPHIYPVFHPTLRHDARVG